MKRPITPAELERIKNLKEETGVGTVALLRGRRNEMPHGLNSGKLETWLNGSSKVAKPEHVEYVLELWEKIAREKKGWVEITKDQIEHIQHHRARSGVDPAMLLRISKNPPDSLNAYMISQIITGTVIRAREYHLDFLIKAWEELPDRDESKQDENKTEPLGRAGGNVKITEETHNKLKKYHNLNWLPGFIFKGAVDVPDGLSSGTISSWLSKASTTAHKEHLEWVFTRCEDLAKNV